MNKALISTLLVLTFLFQTQASTVQPNIDYAAFLQQHDMLWDETPHRWEVAPYSGNGNVGFLFYCDRGTDP